jgi:hypothetical protein
MHDCNNSATEHVMNFMVSKAGSILTMDAMIPNVALVTVLNDVMLSQV